MPRALLSGIALLHRIIEAAVVVLFLAMLAVGFGQIINRFFLDASLSWSEEFQRFAHIWLVFITIPIAYRRGAHIGVDLLESYLPPAASRVLVLVFDLCWFALGGALVFTTLRLMAVASRQTAPALGVTMDMVYLGLTIAGAYLMLVAFGRILNDLPRMWKGQST